MPKINSFVVSIKEPETVRRLLTMFPPDTTETGDPDFLNLEWHDESGAIEIAVTDDAGANRRQSFKTATLSVPVLFFEAPGGVFFMAGSHPVVLELADVDLVPWHRELKKRNTRHGFERTEVLASPQSFVIDTGQQTGAIEASRGGEQLAIGKGYEVPKGQSLPTFLEARETATSISNGRDLKHWSQLEGIEAMLHQSPVKTAKFQVRLLPSAVFQQWHGAVGVDVLSRELQSCDFDSVLLFYACLSWALESPGMRVNTSLDALILAIGQDENARQGEREELREKVWRDLLIFDSLEVVGARPGVWREPGLSGSKRAKMDGEKLHSSDALLRILGHRDSTDNAPKEVILVVGEWAAKFQGNREILSEFGNLRLIATIPARRAAGAWARCIGVGLLQHWREKSAKATPIVHKDSEGEVRSQTLKFPAITRRELLLSTLRPNHDVEEILDGSNPQRAKTYWEKAVELLQSAGVIGYYKELKPIPATRWKEDWLDQPLDIRPKGDALSDAREINTTAVKARKRKPTSPKN